MLFKFTTTKPPAIEIWNTLSAYDFKPNKGYTTDQIRFICYYIFQIKEFKKAKEVVNNYLEDKTSIYLLINFTDGSEQLFNTLQLPPAGFPHFVNESLYIPYYMFMQLNVDVAFNLWTNLFNRETYAPYEEDYITANQQSITESITEYKLWSLQPSLDSLFKIFSIDESKSPVVIVDRKDIEQHLQKYLHQYLKDTSIYDYSSPIVIPPFKLRSTDVS